MTDSTSTVPPVDSERASLCSLPAELKLAILCHLHDETSLRKLIKAVPVYRTIKRDNHSQVLTSITIHHLTHRGFDPFASHDVVEICLRGYKELSPEFKTALQTFSQACQQHQASKSVKALKVPIAVCELLLTVVHASSWLIKEPEVDKPGDDKLVSGPKVHALPFTYLPNEGDKEAMYANGERMFRAKTLVGIVDHRYGHSNYSVVFVGEWFQRCRDLEMSVDCALWKTQFSFACEDSDDEVWMEWLVRYYDREV